MATRESVKRIAATTTNKRCVNRLMLMGGELTVTVPEVVEIRKSLAHLWDNGTPALREYMVSLGYVRNNVGGL